MKLLKTGTLIITISLSVTLNDIVKQASAQPYCGSDENFEKPASTTRTLKLEKFGIAVKIPSNYRAMKKQDGSVEILHPNTFKRLQCLAQGGQGHGGYYSKRIQLVKDDLTMNLRKQALKYADESINTSGEFKPEVKNIFSYKNHDISGYVVASKSGYSVFFLGTIPNSSKLLKVSAVCDCQVKTKDITSLLDRISLLN